MKWSHVCFPSSIAKAGADQTLHVWTDDKRDLENLRCIPQVVGFKGAQHSHLRVLDDPGLWSCISTEYALILGALRRQDGHVEKCVISAIVIAFPLDVPGRLTLTLTHLLDPTNRTAPTQSPNSPGRLPCLGGLLNRCEPEDDACDASHIPGRCRASSTDAPTHQPGCLTQTDTPHLQDGGGTASRGP